MLVHMNMYVYIYMFIYMYIYTGIPIQYHTAHKLDFEISKQNVLLASVAMCYLQCKTAEEFGIVCNSCE